MTVAWIPSDSEASWLDDGYAYTVACERQGGGLLLAVSRVLAAGRMSPIVGRRIFSGQDEPLLGAILGVEGPARTILVDEVIRGGAFTLGDILSCCSCEIDIEQ
jgi:hypothetical protein